MMIHTAIANRLWTVQEIFFTTLTKNHFTNYNRNFYFHKVRSVDGFLLPMEMWTEGVCVYVHIGNWFCEGLGNVSWVKKKYTFSNFVSTFLFENGFTSVWYSNINELECNCLMSARAQYEWHIQHMILC